MTASVRGISAAGREGSRTLELREYTVVYKVNTDDKADGASIVMDAPFVPQIGDLYAPGNDTDNAAVVVAKNARQLETPFEWEIDVTYSTDVGDVDLQNLQQNIDNPLNEPPVIKLGFQPRTILVPGQYNDPLGPPGDKGWEHGIFAPNGELFEPQPEVEIEEPVMHITRNVASIDRQALRVLANSVNADYFDDAEPRQLRLKSPEAERKFHNTIGYYWVVNYSLVFRFETWDIQILNQGHFYWPNGKPTSVWSTTTLPSVKRLLSGEPRLVNLTTDGNINTTATPTYTRIRFFREVQFSALGLL